MYLECIFIVFDECIFLLLCVLYLKELVVIYSVLHFDTGNCDIK